ncbi:MAG: hypothetical protein LAKADJCE_00534 [Candidatus Argoarchaeum ethanivorans]|uniref:HicB-like antitoxin of toxin-antitoxin system domain-containing protein n=1 Tax=Candidatus Argoarchaeum ethanivorans TaxID=2608793 RepID=A0A811TFK7_9EURY|nr:MAG: hypothetical protein LAKADJCE_00534 [Candidatus Argoarchaeum ethanivorans]
MQRYRISVVIEKDVDGYFAFCPELQGCYTQGDNYEEVLENIRDAIRIHIEDRRGDKEDSGSNRMKGKLPRITAGKVTKVLEIIAS